MSLVLVCFMVLKALRTPEIFRGVLFRHENRNEEAVVNNELLLNIEDSGYITNNGTTETKIDLQSPNKYNSNILITDDTINKTVELKERDTKAPNMAQACYDYQRPGASVSKGHFDYAV